jgi:lipid-binding SYLF domain-containing protein
MRSNRTRLLVGITVFAASAVTGLGCSHGQSSSSTTTTAAQQPTNKDRDRAISELNDATRTLGDLNVQSLVPKERLEGAQCAVVAPSLVKGAFLVGGQHGSGVVSCRTQDGWSGPIFIKMTGASGGLQAGLQSSDVLMIVQTQKGREQLFTSGIKLGAGMSVAAGPVGKGKTAGTDVSSNADIITYARSKGLFAGVDLNGVSLSHDDGANAALYGSSADVHAILDGRIRAPAEARPFLDELKVVFPAAKPSMASSE